MLFFFSQYVICVSSGKLKEKLLLLRFKFIKLIITLFSFHTVEKVYHIRKNNFPINKKQNLQMQG